MKHAGTQPHPRVVVPKLYDLKRTVSLSKDAEQRLKWIDYYQAHGSNGRLTCRHYGIAHRTFYRYTTDGSSCKAYAALKLALTALLECGSTDTAAGS